MKIEANKRYLFNWDGKLKEFYVFEVSEKAVRLRAQKEVPEFGVWYMRADIEQLVVEELKVQ